MRPPGDYVNEMPRHPIDDATVEAILAGTAGREDFAGLMALVDDVRTAARGPAPIPSPALAAMLARGVSTETGAQPRTAASNVAGSAPQTAGLPKWRQKKMALKELIAGLSVAGKLALGASVAAAATTTAGAAGVLPRPVQHVVSSTVGAVTPFDFPDPVHDSAAPSLEPAGPPTTEPAPATTVPAPLVPGDDHAGPTPRDANVLPPAPPSTTVPHESHDTHGSHDVSPAPPAPEPPKPPVVPPAPEPAPAPHESHDGPAPSPEPTTAPHENPVVPPPTTAPEQPTPESMSLSCTQATNAVSCSWTVATVDFQKYVVLRTSSDGKPGRVVYQSDNKTHVSMTDASNISPNTAYTYMVIAVRADGATVGHSNRVTVSFGAI